MQVEKRLIVEAINTIEELIDTLKYETCINSIEIEEYKKIKEKLEEVVINEIAN